MHEWIGWVPGEVKSVAWPKGYRHRAMIRQAAAELKDYVVGMQRATPDAARITADDLISDGLCTSGEREVLDRLPTPDPRHLP